MAVRVCIKGLELNKAQPGKGWRCCKKKIEMPADSRQPCEIKGPGFQAVARLKPGSMCFGSFYVGMEVISDVKS